MKEGRKEGRYHDGKSHQSINEQMHKKPRFREKSELSTLKHVFVRHRPDIGQSNSTHLLAGLFFGNEVLEKIEYKK